MRLQKSPLDIGEAARFWHAGQFTSLPEHILDQRIPKLPTNIKPDEIRLLTRTRRSLMNAGLLNSLKDLEGLSIRELLELRNFGVRSLGDLLRALASLVPARGARKPSRAAHSALSKEARRLREAARFWHAGQLTGLTEDILNHRVPRLPAKVKPDELRLLARTRNSLMNAGLLNSLMDLEGQSIRELLRVRRFGVRSLADLLGALAPLVPASGARKPSRAAHNALRKEARKLRNTSHAELVSRDDPRFRDILREIDYSARDARHAAERLVSGAYKPGNPAATARLIRQLRGRINRISKLKLEDELWDLSSIAKNERDRRITMRRFGWDGKEPATLRVVGDSFGVAHESVRLICNPIIQSFAGNRAFARALDGVLEFISKNADQSADLIENELFTTGLVRSQFSLKSLLSAAEILGRDTAVLKSMIGSDAWTGVRKRENT